MAERRGVGVPCHCQVCRLLLFHEIDQGIGKTVYGTCRNTLGIPEITVDHGKIGTVCQCRTINKEEFVRHKNTFSASFDICGPDSQASIVEKNYKISDF